MYNTEITQIEATVVIILTSDCTKFSCGRTIPLWECECDTKTLHKIAQREALSFNEEIGVGLVKYEIVDFRQ
jgi:hypothetical protein